MLRRYSAGKFAPSGTYLNRKTWEWEVISGIGDYLPIGQDVTYYRVPMPLVLALGPLIGLAFILFLPLAVPTLALYAALKAISENLPWRRPRARKEHPAAR